MAVAAVADLSPARLVLPAPAAVTPLEPVARYAALGAGPLPAPCSPTSHQLQPQQLRTTLMVNYNSRCIIPHWTKNRHHPTFCICACVCVCER